MAAPDEGTAARSIDIFPWNVQFNTGLPELDAQHRELVRLFNELASRFAFDPDRRALDRILSELAACVSRHAATEEAVWRDCQPDDAELAAHLAAHQNFTAVIVPLKAGYAHKPIAASMGEALTVLARWLASHILEHDHYFARAAQGMRAGLPREESWRQAGAALEGPARATRDLMLATYEALTANAVTLLREMAERRQVEHSLQESEERFRAIVEQSPIGIILHDHGRVVQVNEAAVEMFGYESREALERSDIFANVAPEQRTDVVEHARRRLRGEAVEGMYETVGLRRDGSRFPLMLVPRTMGTADGAVIAAFLMDLSEAKRARETERALHRTVKLLSRCNALLVRAADKQALLAGVCQLAVEVGGYRLAWVGYAEHDAQQSVRPVAVAGHDDGYVTAAHASWGDNPRGHGPIGRAIRGGKPVIAQDIACTDECALWRAAMLERGYHAAIALPLKVEHKTIGMLAIYSANTEAFGAAEVALLEELTSDLSFGIEALRVREAREAALRDLKRESDKNRALLHNASDGVHILDEGGCLIEASDSFFAMLGYTRAELMGKHLSTWDATAWQPGELERRYRHKLTCDAREEFVTRHRHKNGSIMDVEISTFPLTIEGRRMLFNSSRDVTESRRVRGQLEQTTQNLRQLLADFDSTLEAKRTHIAREVHDELGQVLTSLGFAISTLRVKYGSMDPDLMRIAREMSALNERALEVARNVAENLRPAVLDMGIVSAIEWLCDDTRAQTGLRCDFRTLGNLNDMDQTQVDTVFRIVQESLTNVMRHAGACRVTIILSRHGENLHLTIHDNGCGFDPGEIGKRKSFGLLGMEERVRSMGGNFRLTSAPEEGTTVVADMPYRKKRNEP